MDFAKARELMVEQQVRPWDVLDHRVLNTMSRIPREAFLPEAHRNLAYADVELPLDPGNVNFSHKPVFDGRTLQTVLVQDDESVLEVGTGSGYLTACLAAMCHDVTSIERDAELAAAAAAKLASLKVANASVIQGDALSAPVLTERSFDVIVVNAAMSGFPEAFLSALKPGGRMFFVRGVAPAMEACLLTKDAGGHGHTTRVIFETEIPYLVGAAPVSTFVL